MNTVSIYALFDTSLKIPVYVGASINLKNRLSGHLSSTLKKYKNKNSICILELEKASLSDAAEREKYWYEKYISEGFTLLNNSNQQYYRTPASNGYSLVQIALLCLSFNKSPQTIARWIKKNDDRLTSDKAKLALIKK